MTVKHAAKINKWFISTSSLALSFCFADAKANWRDTIPPEMYEAELLGATPAPLSESQIEEVKATPLPLLHPHVRAQFEQLAERQLEEETGICDEQKSEFNSIKRRFGALRKRKDPDQETELHVRVHDPYAPVMTSDEARSPTPAPLPAAPPPHIDQISTTPPTCWRRVPRWAEEKWSRVVAETLERGSFPDLLLLPIARLRRCTRRQLKTQMANESATPDFSIRRGPDRSPEELLVLRASRLAADGHSSRAAKLLSRVVHKLPDAATIKSKLLALHPPDPAPFQPPLPVNSPMVVDPDVLRHIVSAHATGSAPGPSGWTFDLLDQALRHDDHDRIKQRVARLVGEILSGAISDKELFECILVAIPKADGGLRPITMCEMFLKLAECYALKMAHMTFSPRQFGCGVQSGAEIMIHAIRRDFQQGRIILALDSKNAFNSVHRDAIRKSASRYPILAALFNGAYGCPTRLRSTWGDFQSVGGVRQGSPLSAALFCAAIDEALEKLHETFGDHVRVYAYMDDIVLSAPSMHFAYHATLLLKAELRKVGLELNDDKCVILMQEGVDLEIPPLFAKFQRTCGTKILGCPIGSSDCCAKVLQKQFGSIETVIHRILSLGSQPAAYTILHDSVIGKPLYLARTCEPAHFAPFAQRFDELTLEAFSKVCDAQIDHPEIVRLSRQRGGAGITAMAPIHTSLYEASVAGRATKPVMHDADARVFEATKALDPTTQRILEMNGPQSLNWLRADSKWIPEDFAAALRARWNLIPQGISVEIGSLQCPWCSSTFRRTEWPQHILCCNCAPRASSRNRKHYTVGTAIYEEVAPFVTAIREPRDYANPEAPANPKMYSGADLKVTVDGACVVFDHTVVHAAAPSSIDRSVPKLFEAAVARKNNSYLKLAKDAGELFFPLPILSSSLVRPLEVKLLKHTFQDTGVDVALLLIRMQLAVAKGNAKAGSLAAKWLRQA